MSVFVDTGAFVAFALRRDDRHMEATACFEQLLASREPLVTSSWVFGETVSFIRRRAGYAAARDAGERMRSSPSLEIVAADAEITEAAWEHFTSYQFDDLSLVDCVSFALMRVRRIRKVFTFDGHFAQAGFDLVPRVGRLEEQTAATYATSPAAGKRDDAAWATAASRAMSEIRIDEGRTPSPGRPRRSRT